MDTDSLSMDLEEEPIRKKKAILEEMTEVAEVKTINNWNKEDVRRLKCQYNNEEVRLEADLLKERYERTVNSDGYNEVGDSTNGDRLTEEKEKKTNVKRDEFLFLQSS